jgi:hypothetical protein
MSVHGVPTSALWDEMSKGAEEICTVANNSLSETLNSTTGRNDLGVGD